MRRVLALVLLIAAASGLGLASAPPALAHAMVMGSDPADGSRLKSVPSSVSVMFDESVTLDNVGYLRVVDEVGRRVDTGSSRAAGAMISVALKSGLGDGSYLASFRIVSADGHPVVGAIRFVVGNGALLAVGATPSTVDGGTSVAFDVARWLAFAGFALVGGGWLLLTVWPEGCDDQRARRLLCGGWSGRHGGGAAELLLQGPYVAGVGPGAAARWSLLDATLHMTYGTAHWIRFLLLGALGAVLAARLNHTRRRWIAEVFGGLGIGIAATYAASGHAQAQHPRWLAIASDTAHLSAMAAWVGGLAYILAALLPRREPAELRRVLPVFSRTAFCAVGVLAVSGAYQAWIGIGAVDAITSSRYGQLVLVKVAIFGGLLALGNLSRTAVRRRWVRPVAYATDGDAPVNKPAVDLRPMRRSVFAELLLAAVVLAVTSVLVAESPGLDALAVSQTKPHSATVSLGGSRRATVTINPARQGPVTITVSLSPGPRPQRLTATAALPAKELGPVPIPLTTRDGSTYAASAVALPSAGRWTVTLTIRTSEFDSEVADVAIRLR